jgi:regulator of protease activity HflC (stomatin/prohibitin superfamily)
MKIIIPLIIIIAAVFAAWAVKIFRHTFCVPEGWAGLVYQHGLFVRRQNAGRRIVWGHGWTMQLIDLRNTSLVIACPDALTADHIGFNARLMVTCRIMEPAKAMHEAQCWNAALQHATQKALRAVAGTVTVETLWHQRLEIGAQVLARVQPEAAKLGIQVAAVEVWGTTGGVKNGKSEVAASAHQ